MAADYQARAADHAKQRRREWITLECERRSIRIERRTQSFRLSGPGVSVLVHDLADLNDTDLTPFLPRELQG